jgi:hypothetical protein
MEVTAACMKGVLHSRKYTAVFSLSKCNHGTTIKETAPGIEHTGGLRLSFKEA